MNLRRSYRRSACLAVALFLALLTFIPAMAQDDSQTQEESTGLREKLDTSEELQEQFDSNPVLFFAAIFAIGVITSLTPCVLPMIPITVSIVTGSKQAVAGQSKFRSTFSGLASGMIYVLGISITYALLGILVAIIGFRVRAILQSPVVQAGLGAIFVVLGLSMTGLFSLPIPGWGRASADVIAQRQKAKKSLLTVFVLGLISGIMASPCVTPVIGALLLWVANSGNWWIGFWALFVFGWGMGLLLIVLGVTGWVISSGKWMLTVKTILGLLLVLMGLWIVIQGVRGQPLFPVSWLG